MERPKSEGRTNIEPKALPLTIAVTIASDPLVSYGSTKLQLMHWYESFELMNKFAKLLYRRTVELHPRNWRISVYVPIKIF